MYVYFILALVYVIVFKKNRAMGDHCTSVIYIYQFVIDSSEIQNFI